MRSPILRWPRLPLPRPLLLLLLVAGLAGPAPAAEDPPKPPPPPPLDATTRDFHQRHLVIRVAPDLGRGTVEGRVTLEFESLVEDLATLRLHTQDTEVRRVEGTAGAELPHETKDGVLSVRLPGPLDPGATGTVTVHYLSRPRRGLYFHRPTAAHPDTPLLMYSQGQGNDNRHWIPCYDEPDDRCSWEVHARVPADLGTVSNGVLEGSEAHGDGTRTDRWRFAHRSPTYLVSLVVARFESVAEEHDGVRVEYHGPPGRREDLLASLGDTPRMIRFFSEVAGPYPFPRYAQTYVWDFVYGGMENTTATTLNLRGLHGREVEPNYSATPLVAHELAHMWFGDLLTCRTWEHIWLNEGFATYLTDLWYEHAEGEESFLLRRRDQNKGYQSGTPRPETLELAKPPRGDIPLELFGGKQYNRGAAILHMLRREVGDAAFRGGVRRYVERFHDRCVSSEDFRRVMEDVAGRDLKWFFDQWVYGAGYPVLEVRRDGRRLVVRQVQPQRGGQGLFRLTVPVRVGAGGPVAPLGIYRERHEFTLPADAPPGSFLRFGVGGDLLMRVDLEQDLATWAEALAADPDVTGRLDAAEALEVYGPDAVPALARALADDRSWAVRRAAAEILGRLPCPVAAPALVAATRDPDSRVREAVLAALGGKCRAEAGDAVVEALRAEKHPWVLAEAARAAGRLKAAGAFEALEALLGVASHEEVVRAGALEGLRHLGDPRATELALPFLDYSWGRGGTHKMRRAALDTVTALAPDAPATHKALVGLLADPYHGMRAWAAEACGKYGVREAVETLRAMAENDWHDGAKAAAKGALSNLVKAP